MYALNETFAYEKLRAAQGTVVPWFYGTGQKRCFWHVKRGFTYYPGQFTLPDGTVLYGLLMEYIEGFDLYPDFARTLSIKRQIDVVSSSPVTSGQLTKPNLLYIDP
jgi:hypothetical protein